ncbi:hypothetical protein ACEPAF_8328 [Sanghuangporus sanghuang]
MRQPFKSPSAVRTAHSFDPSRDIWTEMLGEIVETVNDLVNLAERNVTRIFYEPWPPVDYGKQARPTQTSYPGAYARQQTYFQKVQASPRTAVQRSTVLQSRTPSTAYRTQTPRLGTKSPPSRPAKESRSDPKLRRSANVDEQRTTTIRRVVPSPVLPRPASAPSAVQSTTTTGAREKRPSLAKPIRADTRRTQSLRLDDFRPDLAQCDVLVIAVAEMEICKEIFTGWRAQLKLTDSKRTDKLEQAIISTVRKLDIGASAALRASHNLIRNYKNLLRAVERNLEQVSQSRTGGPIFTSEISSLATAISAHSRALSSYVKQIQERLRMLVKDIEKTKESADKRALKRKIWRWLARVFQALSALISAGGAMFALFHPIGLLESITIGGASMLSGAAARLCELIQDKYSETTFDEILTFLRDHVPESARAAEIALTSFQACHRILQVELEVRKGKRYDWVSSYDARRARGQWTQAEQRLRTSRLGK